MPKTPEDVANERIAYLYGLAKKKLKTDPVISRRSIRMLRALATKHNILIKDKKRTFCLDCNTLLTPSTARTRIHNDRRIITCGHCGRVKRLGLN